MAAAKNVEASTDPLDAVLMMKAMTRVMEVAPSAAPGVAEVMVDDLRRITADVARRGLVHERALAEAYEQVGPQMERDIVNNLYPGHMVPKIVESLNQPSL